MTYKTSLDTAAKIITIGVAILFTLIIAGQYAIVKTAGATVPFYAVAGLLFLIYGLAFLFRPVSYSTEGNGLVIRRIVSNVTIARSAIKTIEIVGKNKTRGSIRTFGVGGLFGYFGYFVNREMGKMIWYATRRDRTVLIVTNDNKKIIITPNDPDAFILDMHK